MDEIDAIGGRRFSEGTSADREIQRTLMELLNQMDGFDRLGQVKMIMATNRPDVLDPALLRPGRLDRKIGERLAENTFLQSLHCSLYLSPSFLLSFPLPLACLFPSPSSSSFPSHHLSLPPSFLLSFSSSPQRFHCPMSRQDLTSSRFMPLPSQNTEK